MPEDLLFHGDNLRDRLVLLRQELAKEVQQADEDYLLNTDEKEWASYLVEKYAVDVPEVSADGAWVEDEGETRVDVSHEHFNRAIFDPSTPTYIAGRALTVHIPYTGDGQLFRLRPSTYSLNPPRASVRQGELALRFKFPHDQRPPIQAATQAVISAVGQYLTWQRADVAGFNAGLLSDSRGAITERRQRVLSDHEFLDNLGLPVRKREDAPTTYATPGITRKPAPQVPDRRGGSGKSGPKASAPKGLEPTLARDFYEHISQVTRSMGHSMERTPEGYEAWDEERLRDALLVMLNSHYEGQATGETFNRAGKTDILVRVEDRNVFIGECKWWSGASGYSDALDQLFSYTTWRDTKLALVMFVRAKGLTGIIEKGKAALVEHEQFLAWENARDETELRARMSWPGDAERHATLTVFFFHLAQPG